MDADKDYLSNRITQLEDTIRELELELHVLNVKNLNLQNENEKLMQQLASGSGGGH